MILKVLIVEDSPLLRKILHEAIRSAGFIPYEAENGRNGLTSVREITPDIILLDVLMPVMDGMMMYEELRKETWGETVPVIMLTSSEGTEIQNWITEQRLDTVKKDDEMSERDRTHRVSPAERVRTLVLKCSARRKRNRQASLTRSKHHMSYSNSRKSPFGMQCEAVD